MKIMTKIKTGITILLLGVIVFSLFVDLSTISAKSPIPKTKQEMESWLLNNSVQTDTNRKPVTFTESFLPTNIDEIKYEPSYEPTKTTRSITKYTGKKFIDKTGKTQYEYKTVISSLPMFTNDLQDIDCTWYKDGKFFIAGNNLFDATVTDTTVQSNKDNQFMVWNPTVWVDGEEVKVKDVTPIILGVDPINENYHGNTLEWDYGICVRHLRIIQGQLQETYIFSKDPKGDVEIRSGTAKDSGFIYEVTPFAYDAEGTSIKISKEKLIKKDALTSAIYPVTIDPTVSYKDLQDWNVMCWASSGSYNTVWAATTASTLESGDTGTIGQRSSGSFRIDRSFLCFNTTNLPSSYNVTSANLSLYFRTDYSVTDFLVSIQSGMPTYPQIPLVASDYDRLNYGTTVYGCLSTVGLTMGHYSNISFDPNLVQKSGITKLCIRSSRDISGIAPATDEFLYFWTFLKGDSYSPVLYVTYTTGALPLGTTYNLSTPNGYLSKTLNIPSYLSAWNASSASDSYPGASISIVGTFPVMGSSVIVNRGYLSFDTSPLPNNIQILSANLSLIGYTTNNSQPYSLVIQNGQPIYPHNPLIANDFFKDLYAGNGGSINFSNFSTGLSNPNIISLNTSGISWINQYGLTKLCLRISSDITGTWNGSNEYLKYYNAFANTAYQPTLTIVYQAILPPTANTSPASYVTKTSARLNGLLNNSNGELCNVSFEYRLDGDIANWGFETGDPPSNWVDMSGGYFNNSSLTKVEGSYSGNLTRGYIYQNLTLGKYTNKTITASAWINSTALYTAIVILTDVNGTISSPTLTDIWELHSTTLYIDPTSTELQVLLVNFNSSSVSFLDNVMLMHGSVCPVTTPLQTGIDSGTSVYANIIGLWPNTNYSYRIVATNSRGTAYGNWTPFTTSLIMYAPTSLSATPTDTTMALSWFNGLNSSNTYIKYQEGSYPTNPTIGNFVCLTPNSNYLQSGLLPGHTYYYSAWGEDGTGNFTTSYITTFATTLPATVENQSTVVLPVQPNNWFTTPNASSASSLPGYPIVNMIADTFHMPHGTWWFLLGMGFVMVAGLYIYSRSQNLLLAVMVVMVFMGIFGKMGIMPLWVIAPLVVVSLGISWKELR